MKTHGCRWLVCIPLVLLLLLEMPTTGLASSSQPSGTLIPKRRVDGLLLSVGQVDVVLQPKLDATVGSLVFKGQDNDKPSVATWAFSKGSVAARITRVPQGAFLNLTMSLSNNCSCKTDEGISLRISGLRESLETVIVSTTPLSQVAPPTETQTLIEALDYRAVDRLYGVAAAFVLKTGNTLEVVSLYPFAAISYDPSQDSIGLLFRKGRGDLSTSAFESGDTQSVMFYIGAAMSRQTTNNAFLAFASDAEVAFPRRDFGKPFILYGVEGGSWDDVRREAESFGYTLVYSDYTWEYTSLNGGGHYFGLGFETVDRLKQAGLESAMVLGSDGHSIGNSVDVRVNPSEPGLLALIRRQIDNHLATRKWFIADGADIIQDFNPQHKNILEGYMQALLYVRSTGSGIMYNSWHTPRLWLDWISDAVLIEGPTGLLCRDGTRADYVSSGEFFDATREYIRIHSVFFPRRMVVWHDYISLEDSSATDSMAFGLMEGAGSFSFSTSKSGSVVVRPGEITTAMSLLTKMDLIRQLSLGTTRARNFVHLDTGGWTFEALSGGNIRWFGSLQEVLVGDVPIPVNFDGTYCTFNIEPSHVTVIPIPL